MINIRNSGHPKTVFLTIVLIVIWNTATYFISNHFYAAKNNELIDRETRISQERANDLADSIRRNLNYLHGIPDLLAELKQVKKYTAEFNNASSAPTLEVRRKRWTEDPGLNDLSRYLAEAKKDLNADMINVLNTSGDCIASSDWNQTGSCIGNNYAERDFFKKNQRHLRGMQYAVGKTTGIAGLYFSSPVYSDGKFMGAVVTKVDIPNLSYLIGQFDAFITDENGIVVLAHDKALEMLALPDAPALKMTEQEKFARYRVKRFSDMAIKPWEDRRFKSLVHVQNEPAPHLLNSKAIPEYGLNVYIENEIPALENRNQIWLTILICISGSMLIMAMAGIALYLKTIRISREMLWRRANFDTLTDLPNRNLFRDRLTQEIKKTDRTQLPLALFLIDLDQFKEVNDTLGHDMGDILLEEAARRIVACVRDSDTVARLGGDEFTVVLPQISQPIYVEEVAKKIIASLSEPFRLKHETAYVSASLGITLYPADANNIDSMMRNADQAMYVAKNEGRNRYSYFTIALQEAAQKRLHLTQDLRTAVAEQQFTLYYQPIVELSTNKVHKAEALLRWRHPTRGMVSPSEFIYLAEETRLIVEIGAWIRTEAMHWCRRWNGMYPGGFQISINKSPIEFMDEKSSDDVKSFVSDLQQSGLQGQNFVFEITEGLLLNTDPRVKNKLIALRDAGIQVSIDDFGTGYSSLSYLKKFDIDYLKIDQSFVNNLEHDSDDMALCEAIIVMAHKLGLKVIAEGVETLAQREFLSRAGCDYGQGYLFSEPLPAAEFEAWLTDRND